MIFRSNTYDNNNINILNCLSINDINDIYKKALFLDLEHYIYKVPICVGVFGCCYYDEHNNRLNSTQYMIENKKDSREILNLAKEYFIYAKQKLNKEYIITFSGNNDFTVLNFLFDKYKIDYNIMDNFHHVDLQKVYEKEKKTSIGLKALEKQFGITREAELISGSNLAKTFSKVVKDSTYIERMPVDKKNKILLYNEQDIVSLFYLAINWKEGISKIVIEEGTKEGII